MATGTLPCPFCRFPVRMHEPGQDSNTPEAWSGKQRAFLDHWRLYCEKRPDHGTAKFHIG